MSHNPYASSLPLMPQAQRPTFPMYPPPLPVGGYSPYQSTNINRQPPIYNPNPVGYPNPNNLVPEVISEP